MAELNPPWALQNVGATHPSDLFRDMLKGLRGQAGVVGAGDMAVAQNGTPNMSVNVAAGKAIVDGTQTPLTQGSYFVRNDATVNKAIAAADPTNPRRDLVIAQVQDAFYSGAVNAWQLAVVTGVPAPSPVDPVAPANSLILARVAVAAAASTIVNANITDLRPLGVILNQVVSPVGPTLGATIGTSPLASRADHGHPRSKQWITIDDQSPSGTGTILLGPNPLPTDFVHLAIDWYIRSTNGSVNATLRLNLNGDFGANYDLETVIWQAAAALAGGETLGAAFASLGLVPAATATALYYGAGQARINHYNGATGNKMINSDGGWSESNLTGAAMRAANVKSKWRTTGAPITRLDLSLDLGNFATGSRVTLSGLVA